MEGTAIVISPLIALMKNQVDAIRAVCGDDGVAHYLNSSLNKGAIDMVKSDILHGKTKLLYVAPESLTKADGKGKWWEGYDPQDLYEQRHERSKDSKPNIPSMTIKMEITVESTGRFINLSNFISSVFNEQMEVIN